MGIEKADSDSIVEEYPFLHILLNVGLIGCILYIAFLIISNSATFWINETIRSGDSINFIQLSYIYGIMNMLSFFIAVLLSVGYYALLRSNGSRLALPYVFLSLITYAISWNFLVSFSPDAIILFIAMNSATNIAISLVLAYILWSIKETVSNRALLRYIVLLILIGLTYNYPILFLLSNYVSVATTLSDILLRLPTIIIYLARIIFVALLFKRSQLALAETSSTLIASSERQ